MSGHEDETLAEVLHAEHVAEFPILGGTDLSDPVPASQCGHCQRWARYAARVAVTARADAAEQIAAWSTPSGWVAQQAVVAYLEDGTDPQPWELDVTAKPDAVARVEAWCQEQDRLSKGESPTTRSVRAALAGDETRCAKHPHGYVLAGRCMVCAATEGEEDR